LGELDSAEGDDSDSDSISDEFEFSHEIVAPDGERLLADVQRDTHALLLPQSGNGSREDVEDDLRELNALSRRELLMRYLEVLRSKNGDDQREKDLFRAYQVKQVDEGDRYASPPTPGGPALDYYDGGDALEEDGKGVTTAAADLNVDHLRDEGAWDQQNENDGSKEEVRSSWSSSEEALQACQGLIFNVPLAGTTSCTAGASSAALANISTEVRVQRV